MADTTFSIELKGLNLPDQVRSNIDKSLQDVVMAEIAKTDLGDNVKLEPLPASTERLKSVGPIHGFILRGTQPETPPTERSAEGAIAALPFLGFPMFDELPFGAASLTELLESLYMRPDVRRAVISNSRAFADLLSRDEQASRVFNDLVGGLTIEATDQRVFATGTIVAVVLLSGAAGAVVGWLSRK